MVDVTSKRIQTLTSAASNTPQMRGDTGSVLGDVAQAASFGFEVYQQHKAKKDLETSLLKQQTIEGQITKAASSLETRVRELEVLNLGTRAWDNEVNKILNTVDPSLRSSVIKEYRKLTGKSLLAGLESEESEEIARVKAEQEYELVLESMTPYAPTQEVPEDPEARHEWLRAATREKARREQKVLEAPSTEAGWSIGFNEEVAGGLLRGFEDSLVGTKTDTDIATVIHEMDFASGGLANVYQKYVKEQGGYISIEKAKSAVEPLQSQISSLVKFARRDDFKTMTDNEKSIKARLLTRAVLDQYPEEVGQFIVAGELGVDIPMEAFQQVMGSILRAEEQAGGMPMSKMMEEVENNLSFQNLLPKEKEAVKTFVETSQLNAVEQIVEEAERTGTEDSLTKERMEPYVKSLLMDIGGMTQADRINAHRTGAFSKRLEELSNPQTTAGYRKWGPDIAKNLQPTLELFVEALTTELPASGAQFNLNEDFTLSEVGPGEEPLIEFGDAGIRQVDLGTMRRYNNTIINAINAYENLGMFDYANSLKDALTKTFGSKEEADDAS